MSPSKPPEPHGRVPLPVVSCPHCGSTDVEVEAAFGSQLMTSQYWCRGCRTVFERLKVDPDDSPGDWLESP